MLEQSWEIYISVLLICFCRKHATFFRFRLSFQASPGNSNEPHSPRALADLKKELEDTIYTFQAGRNFESCVVWKLKQNWRNIVKRLEPLPALPVLRSTPWPCVCFFNLHFPRFFLRFQSSPILFLISPTLIWFFYYFIIMLIIFVPVFFSICPVLFLFFRIPANL